MKFWTTCWVASLTSWVWSLHPWEAGAASWRSHYVWPHSQIGLFFTYLTFSIIRDNHGSAITNKDQYFTDWLIVIIHARPHKQDHVSAPDMGKLSLDIMAKLLICGVVAIFHCWYMIWSRLRLQQWINKILIRTLTLNQSFFISKINYYCRYHRMQSM